MSMFRAARATNVPERKTIDAKPTFRFLGISDTAGYAAIREDRFPLSPIHIGRRVVFSAAALERLLAGDAPDDADAA